MKLNVKLKIMNTQEIIKAIDILTSIVDRQIELWMTEKEVKTIKKKILELTDLL